MSDHITKGIPLGHRLSVHIKSLALVVRVFLRSVAIKGHYGNGGHYFNAEDTVIHSADTWRKAFSC